MPRGKKNRTLINYIIDASGSMSGIQNQVRDGFNEYISELKKNGKGTIEVTLTTFDTTERTVYVAKPIEEITGIGNDYVIGGMTALYDAIANTIKRVESQVKPTDKVITVIMTDGGENSSRENTQKEVADLVGSKQDAGNWTFVFLGADQDAWANAQQFGIPQGNVVSYSSHTHDSAMRGVAMASSVLTASAAGTSTANYFSDAGQSTADYEDEEKLKKIAAKEPSLWVPGQKENVSSS